MAEEEKVEEGEFKEANEGGNGQKSPLVLVILLLNTALMGAVAFFQYTSHQKQAQQQTIIDVVKAEMKKAAEGEEDSKEGPGTKRENDGLLLPLETFTANLAQGDGPRRFLRLNAVLKFSKTSSEEEFKARKPQIRDTIISILNSKRPADLLKVEGKAYLKEEIKAAINAFLVDGAVIDVYYVGFQVT